MATGGIETSSITACESTDEYKEKFFTVPASPGDVYRSRVWEAMRKFCKEDLLTDVMLAAEGRSIPCHKVLLSAASKFFSDKIITKPESLEHNILDIDGIDFDTLTSVVAYIYSGKIQLTVKKIEKMLPASVSLMLPELTDECKTFLDEAVNNDTSDCSAVYKLAKANSLTKTADKAWQVLRRNFQDIAATDAFKDITETELQEYIRDEELNVAFEDPVFEAVVTWVRHDVNKRQNRFESLMEHITLSHCSLNFLGDVVMKEPLVQASSCFQNAPEGNAPPCHIPFLTTGWGG